MTANYCPACNERLPQPTGEGCCPQCGAELQAAATQPSFDETQELAGPVQTHFDGISPPSNSSPPRELDKLVGETIHVYQCESLLGRGGMGHVFVARHKPLQRRCALKILSRKSWARDQEYVERFQQEGRAAAALNHPNITIVHAIGEEKGLHYLEMELMTGGTLQQLVQREGPVSPTRAAQLLAQVSDGLGAAHEHGIVHRDLKPDNVLLTSNLLPKIADFGLAKRVASSEGNALAGTPNYMAPELFAGKSPSLATDVYALGVTFYTLLAGRVPFAGANLSELMSAVANQPVPELGIDLPPAVASCLDEMLAKDPLARIPDGSVAHERLTDILEQLRDLDELVAEAFVGEEMVVPQEPPFEHPDRRIITVHLAQGRRQKVILERAAPRGDDDQMLLIYSVCCDADSQFYESALRLNGRMFHGGVAIREFHGKPMFCVVNTYPWATVDPEEIRVSTMEVAEHADAVEHELTGKDER